jgi:hypothetical protein
MGMDFYYDSQSITITQTKYDMEISERYFMISAKLVFISVACGSKMSKVYGDSLNDATSYHNIVGALQ